MPWRRSQCTFWDFLVDCIGFVEHSESFKYLDPVINYSLTSDGDVCKRVKSAKVAFGASNNIFGEMNLSEKVYGQVYTAMALSILLNCCEEFLLREYLFDKAFFCRLGILNLGSHYYMG